MQQRHVGADDPGSPLYGQPLSHLTVTAPLAQGSHEVRANKSPPCVTGRGAERPRCGMKRGGSAGRTGSRRSACDALRPCETIAVGDCRLRGCPYSGPPGSSAPTTPHPSPAGDTFSSKEKAVGSFSNCRGRRPRRPDNPSVFCCAKSTLPYTGRAFGSAHFMAPLCKGSCRRMPTEGLSLRRAAGVVSPYSTSSVTRRDGSCHLLLEEKAFGCAHCRGRRYASKKEEAVKKVCHSEPQAKNL